VPHPPWPTQQDKTKPPWQSGLEAPLSTPLLAVDSGRQAASPPGRSTLALARNGR
jgi:hypothetical protein